jgi:membrane-associated phospholipid phosphatase
MNAFREWLLSLDLEAWHYLHLMWRSTFLDALTPYIRNQFTWVPLYLFLAVFMPYNFGRRGWLWCIGFLLCFAFADIISGTLIKPWVERVRPCNDPRFMHLTRLIVPRSSGWSFPSSHAANHFALGAFSAVTLHGRLKWFWPFPMCWALAVAYAQVYVGVHWPTDVIGGGLMGLIIGFVIAKLFDHKWSLA